MQLKEKKSTIEKDKRKMESELERERQKIGKQVFLQVVQKKQQQQQQVDTTTTSPVAQSSPINNTQTQPDMLLKSPREPTRRQWDKTNKINSLIEIVDQQNEGQAQAVTTATTATTNSNSTSSMSSTPTSSASQSPPSSKTANTMANPELSQMAVDLSKAYYSRDEVMRAIESLKDRYLKESHSPSGPALEAALANKTSPTWTGSGGNNSSRGLPNVTIVREIESLSGKLRDLQNEISRLTLQQQQVQQQGQKTSPINRASVVLSTHSNAVPETSSPTEKSVSENADGLSQQPG